jgi:RHS repeat-associated protein
MTDGQGTTKLETNGSQTITSTQETEAFGRFIGGTGSTASPYGYHGADGYRQDGDGPAGLEPYQKVGARYYDATFGRFLTRDTDLSQSPYAYCNGDPVNLSDPTGHEAGLPATFETMAHDGIAGLVDGIERGDGDALDAADASSNLSLSGVVTGTVSQQGTTLKVSGGVTINLGRVTLGASYNETMTSIRTSSFGTFNLGYNFGSASVTASYSTGTFGQAPMGSFTVTIPFGSKPQAGH